MNPEREITLAGDDLSLSLSLSLRRSFNGGSGRRHDAESEGGERWESYVGVRE